MDSLQRKLLVFGAWNGVFYTLLFIGGWIFFAKFIPPYPPSEGADAIAERLRSNFYMIRIAMIMQMIASAAFIIFTAALGSIVSRIEGRAGILTTITHLSGLGLALLTFYPAMWWLTATFRPERDAELLYLLNDTAWLQFIGGLFVGWLIFIGPAIAALLDRGETNLLPRWYGYLSAWVAVLFLPGQFLFFIKTGPLAWNGLISFYVVLFAFVIWMATTIYYVRKAGKQG